MEISALASGSSGNCFYVASKDTAILIDAGISAKQTLQRLQSINENPAKLKGIFITHEHIDHVRGADVLARKLNIPIFATKSTIHAISLCSNKELINCIKSNGVIKIRGLKIEEPFLKTIVPQTPFLSTSMKIKKSQLLQMPDMHAKTYKKTFLIAIFFV